MGRATDHGEEARWTWLESCGRDALSYIIRHMGTGGWLRHLGLRARAICAALLGVLIAAFSGCQDAESSHSRVEPRRYGQRSVDIEDVFSRARHAFHKRDGALSMHGRRFRASLGSGGLLLHPLDGKRQIGLQTLSIVRGKGRNLARTDTPPRRDTSGRASVAHDGIVEHFEGRASSIEQSWDFASAPEGSGDIVVTIDLSGDWTHERTAAGLELRNQRDGTLLTYGRATWIDANHEETRVEPEFSDGSIRLRIPEGIVSASAYPAVLDPTVSPEFGIATPVPNEEDSPFARIACGATRCLVALQIGSSVFGIRLTRGGTLLDSVPFLIGSESPSDTITLAVAARNDDEFLVVWTGGPGTMKTRRIRGSDGVPLEQTVVIGPYSNDFVLASDGTSYLLAFRVLVTNAIETRVRLYRNGTWQVQPTSLGTDTQSNLAIGAGAGKYLVVWDRNKAVRVDGVTGSVLDSPPLTYATYELGTAQSVTFDGANFFLSWHAGEIRGVRIRASDGVVLDPDDLFNQTAGSLIICSDSRVKYHPISTWDGTHVVTYWPSRQSGTEVRVDAARMNTQTGTRADGTTGAAPEFSLGTLTAAMSITGRASYSIDAGAAGGSLVYPRTSVGIRGRTISRSGAGVPSMAATETVLSTGSNDQVRVAVASNGNGYLVAWTDWRAGEDDSLYYARVDATGTVLDPAGVLLGQDISDPAVASDGSDYLITWLNHADAEVYAQPIVAATGVPGASAVRVSVPSSTSSPVQPAIASDGTRYLIAWRQDHSATASDGAYARRLTGGAALIDAQPLELGPNRGAVTVVADRQPNPSQRSFGVAFASAPDEATVRVVRSESGAVISPELSFERGFGDVRGPIGVSSDGSKVVVSWIEERFSVSDNGLMAGAVDLFANQIVVPKRIVRMGSLYELDPPLLTHDGLFHMLFLHGRPSRFADVSLFAQRVTSNVVFVDSSFPTHAGPGFVVAGAISAWEFPSPAAIRIAAASDLEGRTLVAFVDQIERTGEIGWRLRARIVSDDGVVDAGSDTGTPDGGGETDGSADATDVDADGSPESDAAGDSRPDTTADSPGQGGGNTGGSGAGAGGSGAGTGGGSATGGTGTAPAPKTESSGDEGGCGCRTPPGAPATPLGLGVLLLLALRRARRCCPPAR
jgi:MYXO-CTERM domain-containing protein